MAEFDRRTMTLERPVDRRTRSPRLSGFGDRLAQAFSKIDQGRPSADGRGHGREVTEAGAAPMPWEEAPARFPITRHGYDCPSVERYIAELEQEVMALDRELAELNAQGPVKSEIAAEIEQVGEQTSAVLIAAHEQANETLRRAQGQADRCISDAAANAAAMTSEARQQLRELEREKESLLREREQLLDDIRGTTASLASLVDAASERFRANGQDGGPPTEAAEVLDPGNVGD